MRIPMFLIVILTISQSFGQSYDQFLDWEPKTYSCFYTSDSILIDGISTEKSWHKVKWMGDFEDIQGIVNGKPILDTKVKMLWDSQYLYLYAEIEEPHIWATKKKRDDTIYLDNAFEIFIDPDSDGHNFYELEYNALNAVWDLLVLNPQRLYRYPNAISELNIAGLQSAVTIYGSLNDPTDLDSLWALELAIPFAEMSRFDRNLSVPKDKDQWRMNFMRVQWPLCIKNNFYIKNLDSLTGKESEPAFYTWSPTGDVDMHLPERWGYIQFHDKPFSQKNDNFRWDSEEDIKKSMWQLYWEEMRYYSLHGAFTEDLNNLSMMDLDLHFDPKIYVTPNYFEIEHSSMDNDFKWILNMEGKIYSSEKLKIRRIDIDRN